MRIIYQWQQIDEYGQLIVSPLVDANLDYLDINGDHGGFESEDAAIESFKDFERKIPTLSNRYFILVKLYECERVPRARW